jgi:hypothetical protein
MGDHLMRICREAGERIADPKKYPILPVGALPDGDAKAKLVKDVENLITKAIYSSPTIVRSVDEVVMLVRADMTMNALSEASLPGQPTNVAAGMAMRYYAGLLEMAKSLRYDENEYGGKKKVIDDTMRAGYMDEVHERARKDAIFSAGAKFGWWGIKRPDRTENVFDNGINDFYKDEYLKDYYDQYPPPAPAATEGKRSDDK